MAITNIGSSVQTLFCSLFILLLPHLAYPTELLLFGTPGGRGFDPGFYASEVDINTHTFPKNITRISQRCPDLETLINEGKSIQSIHLDLRTANVLVRLGSTTDFAKVTLYRGPFCQRVKSTSCNEESRLQPIMLNVETQSYYVAAFTSYEDRIYFISQTEGGGSSPNSKLKLIELRELTDCESGAKIPFTANSAFNIEKCSILISRIIEEEYNTTSQYKVSSGLAIIPTQSGNVFYTQILRSPLNLNSIDSTGLPVNSITLYRITEDGTREALHEEYITSDYMKYIIQGLGQIVYRNRLLCWVAVDRIVCAQVDRNGRISHARTVMGSAQASSVCHGGFVRLIWLYFFIYRYIR